MRPFLSSDVAIRGAAAADAVAIATAHVAAWRETYGGLLPSSAVQGASQEQRNEQWRRTLADAAVDCFVAETGAAGVIGLASAGAQRDPELAFAGEIHALYLLAAWQGRGIGTALFGLVARALDRRGYGSASLWVLKDNSKARMFYERHGGRVVGERRQSFGATKLVELAYGWADVRMIVEAGMRRR
jgi:ribosomal protein S18 acetylase RimI-like enzyme